MNTPEKGSCKACVDFSLWFLMVIGVLLIISSFGVVVLFLFFFCTLFSVSFSYVIPCVAVHSIHVSLLTGVKYGVWN